MDGEEFTLSREEAEALALGPKFCIMPILSEETFEADIEEMIMKLRWSMMGEESDEKKRKSSLSDAAFGVVVDELFSEEEKINLREEEELEEAKKRMIYDPDEGIMDLSKRRVTDLKANSRVIFPKKQCNFEAEAKFETLRVEAMAIFREHFKKYCNKGGKQPSNLTREQEKGLQSLKKRVKKVSFC